MSYNSRLPFSDIVAKSRVITSAASTQMITRVPWQPGSQKQYSLRKVVVSNTSVSGFNNNIITFWDQDLSSATPATRGNASTGALLTINTAATVSGNVSPTVILGLNELPRVRFEAGICCQAAGINTGIILELEMH
jgi:hypothetical protein